MNPSMNRPTPPILVAQVGSFYRRIFKECERIFREQDFPLDMDQIPVLMMVYYQEGTSQQEICASLGRDKASVNRTVAWLTNKKIARVIPDTTDKRKTRVELTANGKKLAQKADTVLADFNTSLSAVLTPTEAQLFHTLMSKLLENTSK
jgi:DNA-binding MarR family transcriptional regulator